MAFLRQLRNQWNASPFRGPVPYTPPAFGGPSFSGGGDVIARPLQGPAGMGNAPGFHLPRVKERGSFLNTFLTLAEQMLPKAWAHNRSAARWMQRQKQKENQELPGQGNNYTGGFAGKMPDYSLDRPDSREMKMAPYTGNPNGPELDDSKVFGDDGGSSGGGGGGGDNGSNQPVNNPHPEVFAGGWGSAMPGSPAEQAFKDRVMNQQGLGQGPNPTIDQTSFTNEDLKKYSDQTTPQEDIEIDPVTGEAKKKKKGGKSNNGGSEGGGSGGGE